MSKHKFIESTNSVKGVSQLNGIEKEKNRT